MRAVSMYRFIRGHLSTRAFCLRSSSQDKKPWPAKGRIRPRSRPTVYRLQMVPTPQPLCNTLEAAIGPTETPRARSLEFAGLLCCWPHGRHRQHRRGTTRRCTMRCNLARASVGRRKPSNTVWYSQRTLKDRLDQRSSLSSGFEHTILAGANDSVGKWTRTRPKAGQTNAASNHPALTVYGDIVTVSRDSMMAGASLRGQLGVAEKGDSQPGRTNCAHRCWP